MPETAKYRAVETLRNGRQLEIRALQPKDRDALVEATKRSSPHSLYRRFFGVKRGFTEKEINFFLNIDFINHVALLALLEENEQPVIVGGVRYVVSQPGQAELAFMVVDKYQGQGIGAILMRHIIEVARKAGLREFTADVLPDNSAMLKVFDKCGLHQIRKRESRVTHVTLQLS